MEEERTRAAECAELAVLCALNSINIETAKRSERFYPVWPQDGTAEGARAAWEFVRNELERLMAPQFEKAKAEGKAGICHPLVPMLDTYRRELEAMR